LHLARQHGHDAGPRQRDRHLAAAPGPLTHPSRCHISAIQPVAGKAPNPPIDSASGSPCGAPAAGGASHSSSAWPSRRSWRAATSSARVGRAAAAPAPAGTSSTASESMRVNGVTPPIGSRENGQP
jgi:hypothetical protein